jgi:uncharacterized protein YciI
MSKEQFLYQIFPARPDMLTDGPSESEAQVIQDHFDYLQGLTRDSTVLLAGRTQTTDPSTFGMVILQAGSEQEAREIMENDPAVKHGLMRCTLFPYRIAVVSDSISEQA